jgi:hypothetical protein
MHLRGTAHPKKTDRKSGVTTGSRLARGAGGHAARQPACKSKRPVRRTERVLWNSAPMPWEFIPADPGPLIEDSTRKVRKGLHRVKADRQPETRLFPTLREKADSATPEVVPQSAVKAFSFVRLFGLSQRSAS